MLKSAASAASRKTKSRGPRPREAPGRRPDHGFQIRSILKRDLQMGVHFLRQWTCDRRYIIDVHGHCFRRCQWPSRAQRFFDASFSLFLGSVDRWRGPQGLGGWKTKDVHGISSLMFESEAIQILQFPERPTEPQEQIIFWDSVNECRLCSK